MTLLSQKKSPPRFVLGIDTSCDETSFAIYDAQKCEMIANLVSSQVAAHAEHGGVVPELASRMHSENLALLFDGTFTRAGIALADLDAIAVTNTPGLIGCLLVGTSFAKALAYRLGVPLYAVNHLEAHLFSPYVGTTPEFPFLGLVVSGGHTAFYLVTSFDDVTLIGQTVDDAAGEAFDKAAKLMGLGYPGGPIVDRMAQVGDASRFAFTIPKVKMGEKYLSFSGIKTAVHHHVQKLTVLDEQAKLDLSASLQKAIVDALMQKAGYFLREHKVKAFALSGGVAMNSGLRAQAQTLAKKFGINVHLAKPEFCTDNGGMVAYLALNRAVESSPFELSTLPSRKIQARQLARSAT